MHGVGIYYYADGQIYEGQFELDKKTGYGFYRWKDNRKYEGWFLEGK